MRYLTHICKMFTGIITGDIINSRNYNPKVWMITLKTLFNEYGKEPKQWEIYRGDSFQIEVSPEKAMALAIAIKAVVKKKKDLDVRLAIGIGDKTYNAPRISESNGTAFVYSGTSLEKLKKQKIIHKSPWPDFDNTVNTILGLAQLVMREWTPVSAKTFMSKLENPSASQRELARILQKEQSNISRDLKRTGYDEIIQFIEWYRKEINSQTAHL